MFITINGHLGSGKSTVCSLLTEQYGFKVFDTGSMQRKIANDLHISTLELNKKGLTDFSVDHQIDDATVAFAADHNGERIIFDSRLAWHFVPESFKVRLTVAPEIAAERVFQNRRSKEEAYASVREALEKLTDRQNTESERYQLIYHIDIHDESNYDLIVDTSYLSPSEAAKAIIDSYKQFAAQKLDRLHQSCADSNCFISKAFIDGEIPLIDALTVTVDEILHNTLVSMRSRGKDAPNRVLYRVNRLIIAEFQNCNGKEATQKIITDILSSRIKSGLPTHLIAGHDFFDIKYMSQNLRKVITKNFKFLP